MILTLPDLDATTQLGRRLGKLLFPGAVIALVGPLGAGKTHLTRAIAEGLDIPDSRLVTSPTFVLIQEYAGRLPIYHFDAYRLRNVQEFLDLGALEYFAGDGVCLIEWADRIESCLPDEHLRMDMEPTGPTERRVTLTARGARYIALLEQIQSTNEG